jgi:hypothetical protein
MRRLRLQVAHEGSYSGMSSVPDNNGVKNETSLRWQRHQRHYQRPVGIAEREHYPKGGALNGKSVCC